MAYVVRGPEATWKVDARSGTSRSLRSLLERYLPLYSVPGHFVELDALPINQQTGKLERKALPPLRQGGSSVRQRAGLSKHATAAERCRALRELWAGALDVDSDTLEDDWNFFDLGGHSLTGLGLTLGIEQLFGIELSGTEIYEYPTISVNYAYPYAAAKPHTVGGTLEVLKFACTASTKPVQYISSNGIFPGGDDAPYLENDQIDEFVDRMEGGYNQAKWVAERLVWSAVSRGLPVCIYRPGNIGHHSRTGAVNPNDFLSLISKACARLGCVPRAPDWFFEMTPGDFLVAAITKISDDPKHLGRVYNVVQQAPVPADQVFARMESHGHVTERVSLRDWKLPPTGKTTWSSRFWFAPWTQSSRTWPIPASTISASSPGLLRKLV